MKMTKFIFLLSILLIMSGCINKVIIEPTKPWENHYYTVEEFKNGVKDITLNNNESVWVLSNTTLSRLLKNTGKIK